VTTLADLLAAILRAKFDGPRTGHGGEGSSRRARREAAEARQLERWQERIRRARDLGEAEVVE
jgi:hypothetical protein